MFRVIYIIEVFADDGELIARRFSRNKRTGEKIAAKYASYEENVNFRRLSKYEMNLINPEWVEG